MTELLRDGDSGVDGGPAPCRSIYVDRLTRRSILRVIRRRPERLVILDEPDRVTRLGARLLGWAGVVVEFAAFFAGDLRSSNGESVYLTARDQANQIAPVMARLLARRTTALADLDGFGRPGSLSLSLAKLLTMPVFGVAVRIEAARVLSGSERAEVWVEVPAQLPVEVLKELAPDLPVFVNSRRPGNSMALLRAVAGEVARAVRGRRNARRITTWAKEPSVLTVHEEDLLPDRSRRGQLHWLDPAVEPEFRTILLPRHGAPVSCAILPEVLRQRGVDLLTDADLRHCLRLAGHPIQRQLRRASRRCLIATVRAWGAADREAALRAWLLTRLSGKIAAVAEISGARAWVSCEGHMPHPDAVSLIADALGLRTHLFQYSSIRGPTPLFHTNSDEVLTIGRVYAPLYERPRNRPLTIRPIGYPFSLAAALVGERAGALRAELFASGVAFVIAYFEESIQETRWGLIHKSHHLEEIRSLAKAVLDDASLAVLVKTKYVRNTPDRVHPDDPYIGAAMTTGRLRILVAGQHRNVVFPAEAALAADICIGHAFASTAALEAAVSSTRALLVRRYGERTLIDPWLARVNVVYPSIDAALAAIKRHRCGEDPDLGDWTPIIGHLDECRDGRAEERLRSILADAVKGAGAGSPFSGRLADPAGSFSGHRAAL